MRLRPGPTVTMRWLILKSSMLILTNSLFMIPIEKIYHVETRLIVAGAIITCNHGRLFIKIPTRIMARSP
jgi:hypothetical protein